MRRPYFHRRSYLFLSSISVLQEISQRRNADSDIFYKASAEGVPLYERCGFVIKDEVVLEGGKERDDWREYGAVRYTWMERDVRIDSSK